MSCFRLFSRCLRYLLRRATPNATGARAAPGAATSCHRCFLVEPGAALITPSLQFLSSRMFVRWFSSRSCFTLQQISRASRKPTRLPSACQAESAWISREICCYNSLDHLCVPNPATCCKLPRGTPSFGVLNSRADGAFCWVLLSSFCLGGSMYAAMPCSNCSRLIGTI